MPIELQPLREGAEALRRRAQVKLAQLGAVVSDATVDCSSPARSAETVIYEARGTPVVWTRVLVRVHGSGTTNWAEVDRRMAQEGFDPYGPRNALGQTYQSRNYGWVVLADNPEAVMAVKQTGSAWMGPVPPPP